MEHIGHAAFRVLGKARKAAIARQKEIAGAQGEGPAILKVDGKAQALCTTASASSAKRTGS